MFCAFLHIYLCFGVFYFAQIAFCLQALESHRRGFEATEKGFFQREIVPVKGFDAKTNKEVFFCLVFVFCVFIFVFVCFQVLVTVDEGIRWPADKEKMKKLPLLKVYFNFPLGLISLNLSLSSKKKKGRRRSDHCCSCFSGLNSKLKIFVDVAFFLLQVTDGASAVLVVNEKGLKKLGLAPRARIVAMALAGDDPGGCFEMGL
jgi:acetyl-CoA acetyltransferase